MAKYINLEEYQLDYFSNKQGRTVKRGTFGDKLSAKDCLTIAPKAKKPKYVKVNKKPRTNLVQTLSKCGFTCTELVGANGLRLQIKVFRILYPNQIKRMYPQAKGYLYTNSNSRESEVFLI